MQAFTIASSTGRPVWVLAPAFVVVAIAIGVLVLVSLASRSARSKCRVKGCGCAAICTAGSFRRAPSRSTRRTV